MAKGDPIEENNALMANGGKTASAGEDTFGKFLYNKEKGTCLGRTAKSWVQITVFYIIFYACLAAFWGGCLAIFLATLDEKVPRFYGKGTIIGVNPGLGYQPWLKENPDSTLIQVNLKDPSTYKPYVDQIKTVLSKYEDTNNTRVCSTKDTNQNETETSCRFTLDDFKGVCDEATGFGYNEGKPCVILSLNRLIGWSPIDYPADSIPEQVKGRYRTGSIAISCDGTNDVDKEHVGKITYLPKHGIDGKYYPYKVMANYHQPIAMVRFEGVPRNQVVLVECRAFALNIEHDMTARLGLVNFELYIEDKEPTKAPVS